jgi:RNA polymerase sigma-70 factor (ECF subfamily)
VVNRNNQDTNIGGRRREFPSTIWNDVLAAADASSPEQRKRLEQLLATYWKPVFAYIRTSWRKPVEDAKDLTQAFFAHVLQKEYLARLQPALGSFRGYLKRALKHFLIDAERSAAARRPENALLSIEASPAELERIGPASANESPEETYDREWFKRVMDDAIATLKKQLTADDKKTYFEVFRLYFVEAKNEPTYEDVAKRLGLKVTDVRNYLNTCRKELREILKARIRDYVASDDEVEPELIQILKA